jgi:hypothetical protein
MHFCLLTIARGKAHRPAFAFSLKRVEDLDDSRRRFTLTAEDIQLLNPNTRTCPVFRTRRDAEITKAIYRRVPVLIREGDPDGNPWGIKFLRMFDMSNDSRLFRTREQLEADGATLIGNVFTRGTDRWLPLYEAKMLHQFDHRWATYDGGTARDMTDAEKEDPACLATPCYWLPVAEVLSRLDGEDRSWHLSWRDISKPTNERTAIFSALPKAAVGHTAPLLFPDAPASAVAMLSALFNSFALDYVARQKVGGFHLTYGFLMQFAVPAPSALDIDTLDFTVPRVLELTDTATDLAGFAADLGYDGPPFRWDPERRSIIRAELDAAIFRLYGIERDDLDYIMETFPLVRRRDEQRFGAYRTKQLVLQRYDAMAAAESAGQSYVTPLDPPPGGRTAAPNERGAIDVTRSHAVAS